MGMRSTNLPKFLLHKSVASVVVGAAFLTAMPSVALARVDERPEATDAGRPEAEAADTDIDGESRGELVLLTESGPVVDSGDSVWIALKWTAKGGPVRDVRVIAGGRNLEVAYPENTGEYSAPWNGPNLTAGETDYTAFKLEVPDDVEAFKLSVRATYTVGGEERSDKWSLKLPVQSYDGEDLVLENPEIELPEGAGMVELKFTGIAPSLRRFQVMIPNPEKAYLEYPQGDFASLERDNRLSRGETDVARFYIDMSYLGAGEHKLELSAIYRRNGKTVTTPFTVVIRIP